MQVIATAGHVDHGKSTLVGALTGMEPDRWAEERRRGLTIDLGFAWMDPVRVRAIESMDQPAGQVRGVARVALNLRGVARDIPARGMTLRPGRPVDADQHHRCPIGAVGRGAPAAARADRAHGIGAHPGAGPRPGWRSRAGRGPGRRGAGPG